MARLVGINHVALKVGDLEEALDFFGKLLDFELRGRVRGMAFLDMGDQFLALGESDGPPGQGHFGLVVDDREEVRRRLEELGAEIVSTRGLRFRDPWGNQVEIVQYSDVQFTKAPGMGADDLEKSESAIRELREKGLR